MQNLRKLCRISRRLHYRKSSIKPPGGLNWGSLMEGVVYHRGGLISNLKTLFSYLKYSFDTKLKQLQWTFKGNLHSWIKLPLNYWKCCVNWRLIKINWKKEPECAKNWKQIPAILMFEFPGRRHFGSYYVIRLPLLLSSNGCFVHRFPKGMVETMVATVTRHHIQNGGMQKIQISK